MLTKALQDLKAEVLGGATVEEAVGDIAKEHGLNPLLLSRKFTESYTSAEALRATAAAISPERNLDSRITRNVEEACKAYKVEVANAKTKKIRGTTYTVIGRFSNARVRHLLAVSHEDGKTYRVDA